MWKALLLTAELLIYVCLHAKGKRIIKSWLPDKKYLRKNGLWWVISPEAGSVIFYKIRGILKKSPRERINMSRFIELYGPAGNKQYELSRSSQLSLLLILLIIIQLLIFYAGLNLSTLILAIGLIAGVLLAPDKAMENICDNRRREIEDRMPEFLNRLAILVDAGLTVKSALRRIASASTENSLNRELKNLLLQLETGMGENHSFEEFARRCNTPTTTAFAAVVLQNIKKGNRELSAILRVFARYYWDEKKMRAGKMGEEAAAKLMLPMMIVFIGIMILMAAPALFKLSM